MPGIAGKICFGILAAAGVFISSLEFSRILEAKEMRSYPFFTGILQSLETPFRMYVEPGRA